MGVKLNNKNIFKKLKHTYQMNTFMAGKKKHQKIVLIIIKK